MASSLLLCHFLSPSLPILSPSIHMYLHVLEMRHTSMSGLSQTFMSSFRYRGWQGIPFPPVTGHPIAHSDRPGNHQAGGGSTALPWHGAQRSCGHATGDFPCVFVRDNASVPAGEATQTCDFLWLCQTARGRRWYTIIPYCEKAGVKKRVWKE